MSERFQFEWNEQGSGTPILFLPGSFSTARAWAGVWERMAPDLRLISTSLLGCGATTETRDAGDTDMKHEIEHFARVYRRVGAPCHVVGHSFGATVVLATVAAGAISPLSLTLFEANPIGILAPDHPIRRECGDLADRFGRRIDAGDPDAPETIIDFYGGEGTWRAFPEPVRAWWSTVAAANRLDWETVKSFDPTGMVAPCRVSLVRGSETVPLIVELGRQLSDLLGFGPEQVIDGAGHFLIHSHPEDCAAAIRAAVARAPADGDRDQDR